MSGDLQGWWVRDADRAWSMRTSDSPSLSPAPTASSLPRPRCFTIRAVRTSGCRWPAKPGCSAAGRKYSSTSGAGCACLALAREARAEHCRHDWPVITWEQVLEEFGSVGPRYRTNVLVTALDEYESLVSATLATSTPRELIDGATWDYAIKHATGQEASGGRPGRWDDGLAGQGVRLPSAPPTPNGGLPAEMRRAAALRSLGIDRWRVPVAEGMCPSPRSPASVSSSWQHARSRHSGLVRVSAAPRSDLSPRH